MRKVHGCLDHAVAPKLLRCDPLTGLLTRAFFVREVRKIIDRKPAHSYVLSYLDIDGFKVVNDRFGHAEGDRLLRFVAECRRNEVERAGGIVCRDMADIFLALLPNSEKALNEATANLFEVIRGYNLPMGVRVHIGRYVIDDPKMDVNQMIDRALLAVRSIKGSESERIAWFDDTMRIKVLRRQRLVDEMRQALAERQFILYFQPQYDYSIKALYGAEALVRWSHPTLGLIPPAEFIPLFEENGFICELDEYVWEEACKYLREWMDAGLDPVPVAVNISRRDIRNSALPELLSALAAKYGLKPEQLRLEITESAYVDNPQQLIKIVIELQKRGFSVEMDDFGSGYSSLNTLKDVPVDLLKLDMQFSSETETGSRRGSILSSVVRMAHWLKLPVIAEGVETERQADYLKSIGCRLMQGYYFARPMPAEEYARLLETAVKGVRLFVKEETDLKGAAEFLDASTQATLLFNSFVGAAQIAEFDGERLECLRTNDKFYETIGSTRGECVNLNLNILEWLDPESRETAVRTLKESVRTGKEGQCELHFRKLTPEGRDLWTVNRIRFLAKNDDRYTFYISTENITERKELQNRLADEIKKSEALIANMPGGMITLAVNGESTVCEYFSDGVCGLYGYSRAEMEDIFARGISAVIHPDDREYVKQSADRAVKNRAPFSERYRVRRRGGDYIWVSLAGNPAVGADGVLRFYCVYTDITDHMLSEGRLREEQRKTFIQARETELAMGASSLYFWMYNYESGLWTAKNENAQKLWFHTTPPRIHADYKIVYIHPDSQYTIKEADLAIASRQGHSGSVVLHLQKNDAGVEWLRVTYTPVTDADGVVEDVIAVGEDISERVRLERKYEEELRNIEALGDGSVCVKIQANLTRDAVKTWKSPFIKRSGRYTEGLGLVAEIIPSREQRKAFLSTFNRERLIEAFLNGEGAHTLQYQVQPSKDGRPTWMRLTARTYRDPNSGDIMTFQHAGDIDEEESTKAIVGTVASKVWELLALIFVNNG